jgi:multidrug efflux pump subunit AcrA (membrane-fusion protein)
MKTNTTLVVILAVMAQACARQAQETAEQAPPLPVTVARVTTAELPQTFEAGGVIQARTTATLTARILAPVREVRVAPGDRVRAGETLVVLDADALVSQARSATAAASASGQTAVAAAAEQRASEASLALARASYDRIASLNARRSATAQELDNATAALRAAEARAAAAAAATQAAGAQADSARSAGEAAGTTAGFAQVKAPFDGVVTQKMVEPGNMAAPGMPLLRVEDLRGFRLEVRVDESRISRVQAGQPVEVILDVTSGTQQALTGTVAEVSRAVDVDARSFLVKIALPEGRDIRSGTFGRARFSAGTRRGLRLPDRALVRRGQLTSVFVVEEGIARLRLVNVSDHEILAGLSEGETVIVGPPPELVDGRRVTAGGK